MQKDSNIVPYMAFITVEQKQLKTLLTFVNQISQKKSDIEIFSQALIEVDGQKMSISGVNSDIYYKETVSLSLNQDTEKVTFLINTDLFTNSVNLINDDVVSIDINLDKKTAVVQGAKSKHVLRISTDKIEDFSKPESKKDEIKASVVVASNDILEANKTAFISVGNPRTVYQSEFLHICYTLDAENKHLAVVSTDRYRIAKTVIDSEFTAIQDEISNINTNFLVHPKALALLPNFIGAEEFCNLTFQESYLWITRDNKELVLRYGEGKYPDYNKIIPQSFTCNFDVSTAEILESLKQVYFSARMNTNNKSIKLTINPEQKTMKLEAEGIDGFSSQSTVALSSYQGTDEEWSQNFNADYLLTYVSSLKDDAIFWESNPGKPSVLSPKNEKAHKLYLVSGLK